MLDLRHLVTAACLCLAALPSPAVAVAEGSVLDSLPADTCGWIHIHDFEQWNSAFEKSQFQALLKTPAFADFAAAWNAHTASDAFALEFGLTMQEFESLAKGDFVVAWLPAGPNSLTTVAIVDTKDTSDLVEPLLAKAAARFSKHGYQEAALSNDGLQQFTSGEAKAVIGHRSNRLVVAHDATVAAAILNTSNAQGSRPTRDTGFQFVRKHIDGIEKENNSSRVDWYCAPWRLLKHAPSPPNNLALLIEQGFDAANGMGGSLVFDTDHLVTYQAVAHVQQPLHNSAVSLRTKPVQTKLPDWLVARSRGVQVIGVDAQSILNGYGKWFDATEGEGEEGLFELVLEEIRDEPGAPGVDIQVELIDQVASPLLVLRPRLNRQSAIDELAVVMAVRVKQPAVVTRAIERMLNGDPDVSDVIIGNQPAWQFGDLTRNGTRQVLGPDLSQVTLCMHKAHLMVSSEANAIAAITSDASANDDNAATIQTLRSLIANLTQAAPNRSLIGFRFAQGADWMAQGYDRIRNADTIENQEGASVTLGNITITLFNRLISGSAQSAFSQLPTRAIAKKHLGIAMDVAHTSNQHGWVVSGFVEPAHANESDETTDKATDTTTNDLPEN